MDIIRRYRRTSAAISSPFIETLTCRSPPRATRATGPGCKGNWIVWEPSTVIWQRHPPGSPPSALRVQDEEQSIQVPEGDSLRRADLRPDGELRGAFQRRDPG